MQQAYLIVLTMVSIVVLGFLLVVGLISPEMIIWIFLSAFAMYGVYIWLRKRN